jgi:hypothetical protein
MKTWKDIGALEGLRIIILKKKREGGGDRAPCPCVTIFRSRGL